MNNLFVLILLIATSSAFADTHRKTASVGDCGDLDEGIARVRDLAKWTPEKLKGDMMNWYGNSTSRILAALLQAKLDKNPKMPAKEREELQQQIQGLCGSLD